MINETLIEKYFSERLTKEESLEFKNLYDTDTNFKQEVDFLKDIKSVSETEDDAQFKQQLASFESEYSKQNKSSSNKWLKPLIAVAALLVILLSINFLMNTSINEDKIFATYFEPSTNVSAPIVRSDTNETILNNAFIAYSEADYKVAILLFDEAYQASKNSELLFYEGNAHLVLGQTEEAINTFNEHLQNSDVLTNRSHWYLALAYVKTKQVEKAKQELKALIKSGETFKRTEVNSLLKKLE